MGVRQRLIQMVFADNATDSDPVDLLSQVMEDESIVGILVPAGFIGTTLTFTNSIDGGANYYPVLYPTGAAYTISAAASKFLLMDAADTKSLGLIKGIAASQTSGPITLYLIASKVL